jgi:hypothetical protein
MRRGQTAVLFTLMMVPLFGVLDHNSLITYTITISSILYFQRITTGAALISSKYW